MAAITWYMTNNLAGNYQDMSESDPGTEAYASPVTGWIVSTGATNRAKFDSQVERVATAFDATTYPASPLDNTLGDCLRTTSTYNGSFAAANWVVNLCIRANTSAGGTSRGYVRLYRGSNGDGSGATEITSAAQLCSTVTPSTTTTTNSTVTFNPGAFSVGGEYIFIQIAWERVTAGGMTTNDVNFRIGNSASLGTRVVSSDFTSSAVAAGILLE